MDPQMAKGVHGQDVLITRTNADVCLTFYVKDPSDQQAFVTARVFLPHITAYQMAKLIEEQLGPTYKQYLDLIEKLPPPSSGGTSSQGPK